MLLAETDGGEEGAEEDLGVRVAAQLQERQPRVRLLDHLGHGLCKAESYNVKNHNINMVKIAFVLTSRIGYRKCTFLLVTL